MIRGPQFSGIEAQSMAKYLSDRANVTSKKENRSEVKNLLSILKHPPTPEQRPSSSRKKGAGSPEVPLMMCPIYVMRGRSRIFSPGLLERI